MASQATRGGRLTAMAFLNFIASLLQLGCAIAVIAIVRNNLENVYYAYGPRGTFYISYQCLMAKPDSWTGACSYAYSLGSVSIFWVFILALMQCMTYDLFGMGRLMEAIWDAIAMLWWLAGAIVLTVYAADANRADLPARDWRNAVVVLSWVSFLLFAILLVTNIYLMSAYGTSNTALDDADMLGPGPWYTTPFAGVPLGPYPVGHVYYYGPAAAPVPPNMPPPGSVAPEPRAGRASEPFGAP